MTEPARIVVRLDSFAYARGPSVIEGVELAFEPGTRLCLLGPSGCGKSTVLRVLMGLERGAHGEIEENGARVALPAWDQRQDLFGLVPQNPLLFPWKTVRGNLLAARPRGMAKADVAARVDALLAAVGLAHAASSYPWQISQGMAARVSFARALLVRARCLLFDEPFAALDAHTRRGLQGWLSDHLRDAKVPCLFVTHDVREALILGTRIVVLGWPGGVAGAGPARVVADWTGFTPSPEWEERVEAALGPSEG